MELGGLATRAPLIGATSRAEVDEALRAGEIVAVARGRYALPATAQAAQTAHALCGRLAITSAALHHGWEVARPPERPHVLIPRKRRPPAPGVRAEVHHGDVLPEDVVDDIATGVELTLLQCGRSLPFGEALAVFDSALRSGVPPQVLARVARCAAGPGSRQVRRVAALADGRAANPFESVLRAIAIDIDGLHVRPQVRIPTSPAARVDLADEDLMIAIEADSFAWHGDRAALRRDARRHDLLVAAGWCVLRFAWEDVMHARSSWRWCCATSYADRHEPRDPAPVPPGGGPASAPAARCACPTTSG